MAGEEERAIGCMLGAAYGDSLGGAVEFDSLATIRSRYGLAGIRRLDKVLGSFAPGCVTDDTQMAIATAQGLVAAGPRPERSQVLKAVWAAYLDWYKLQGAPGGSRAPGVTCMSAIGSGQMGTLDRRPNDSMGCGGIMRAHPVGLAVADPGGAFALGMDCAVMTHGHVNGFVPSGFLAALVSSLVGGATLDAALAAAEACLDSLAPADAAGTRDALRRAHLMPADDLAKKIDDEVGGKGGWVGHDALAIALFAALQCRNEPLRAVEVAANHSGDSDSTASIAGAIVGAMHGPENFERSLAEQRVALEHDALLRDLARRLSALR